MYCLFCLSFSPTLVVILCMHSVLIGGKDQQMLLEMAHDMQMTDGSMVFVPYDTFLYSLPYQNLSQLILPNNSKLQRAYDAVLTITVDSPEQHSFYQAFAKAQMSGELPKNIKPNQVRGQREWVEKVTQVKKVLKVFVPILTFRIGLASASFPHTVPSTRHKKRSGLANFIVFII